MLSFSIVLFALINFGFPNTSQAAQIVDSPKVLILAPAQKQESILFTNKPIAITKNTIPATKEVAINKLPKDVPFYSQFTDITSVQWQKVGCGVTSLAMIIDYYRPDAVSVNTLLKQGIANGAYLPSAGWTYKGLISLGNKYGVDGDSYDLATLSDKSAFAKFEAYLADGPVIASVHYKFDPKSTIPHLVVINKITNGTIYYNDPAAKIGGKAISKADFLKGWKKRFIVLRPTEKTKGLAEI